MPLLDEWYYGGLMNVFMSFKQSNPIYQFLNLLFTDGMFKICVYLCFAVQASDHYITQSQ